MAAQCQRSRFGYHPQLLRIASYAVFFLAEDFRSHFLFMDGTVLGSECDLNGLFCIEGYGLGDSISDFCPATDYVDHDADQSDSGRKRFCRIRI